MIMPRGEPLLFVGHYWRAGTPTPIRPNLACLDYSAVKYGKLVAYRLDDETQLEPGKFVKVNGWRGPEEAKKEIMEGVARFNDAKEKPAY